MLRPEILREALVAQAGRLAGSRVFATEEPSRRLATRQTWPFAPRVEGWIILLLLFVVAPLAAQGPQYGLGRAATEQEVKALDLSIRPDGANLPPGQGNVADGARLYERECRECHGPEGKGSEETGFIGTPQDLRLDKPKKTVGSYWPYATTLYDYIRRAMPF